MKLILSFLLLVHIQTTFGQLNCKIVIDKNENSIKTCYHKNGKLSTVETWDKIKRTGKIICYASNGKEILHYGLRRFAGHASVYVDYYANGQIKRAEYSDAPDGGIQFWRSIYTFDEQGNQTSFVDLSQPNGHPQLTIPTDDTNKPLKPFIVPIIKPEIKQQELAICGALCNTNFEITNSTNFKLKVLMKAQHNLFVLLNDSIILLKPKQTAKLKSIYLTDKFIPVEQTYQASIIITNKKSKKCKIIFEMPVETKQNKTYRWFVIE